MKARVHMWPKCGGCAWSMDYGWNPWIVNWKIRQVDGFGYGDASASSLACYLFFVFASVTRLIYMDEGKWSDSWIKYTLDTMAAAFWAEYCMAIEVWHAGGDIYDGYWMSQLLSGRNLGGGYVQDCGQRLNNKVAMVIREEFIDPCHVLLCFEQHLGILPKRSEDYALHCWYESG